MEAPEMTPGWRSRRRWLPETGFLREVRRREIHMSARGGRGSRRGRGRGSGGDGQPPPQHFLEGQSNVPIHDPWYSFTYFNPNQLGTPSQPLGIQATGADFFSTYGWYMPLNAKVSSMIYTGNQQQLPTPPPQPQNVDIENAREEHTDVDEGVATIGALKDALSQMATCKLPKTKVRSLLILYSSRIPIKVATPRRKESGWMASHNEKQ
ncbi:LOW QUALITY PROTEIN: hypothetical protein Cgig2_022990 [Carnegiea gigantea]|uniref:Uncharacterized protein n=1 Tax=Carnegiea gigantea TaxID=171969 RepID=A0A9Q1GLQ2_9CARY|nr:LOW QUALITY PROTEIN: hypothetical protein Cgig2_022990 [Carnegiea gigantea]